jgi:hypothetical protein
LLDDQIHDPNQRVKHFLEPTVVAKILTLIGVLVRSGVQLSHFRIAQEEKCRDVGASSADAGSCGIQWEVKVANRHAGQLSLWAGAKTDKRLA